MKRLQVTGDDWTFLSTLSLRRATISGSMMVQGAFISIHALLAESDLFQVLFWQSIQISIHALLAESDHSLLV